MYIITKHLWKKIKRSIFYQTWFLTRVGWSYDLNLTFKLGWRSLHTLYIKNFCLCEVWARKGYGESVYALKTFLMWFDTCKIWSWTSLRSLHTFWPNELCVLIWARLYQGEIIYDTDKYFVFNSAMTLIFDLET